MSDHVKICGLTREADVICAIENGADMLGFIVECQSPRRLSVSRAADLSLPAKGSVKTVAVTVDADLALAQNIASIMQPDFIQLHGDNVTPELAVKMKSLSGLGIIRAVSVRQKSDLDQVTLWQEAADYILLDAPAPQGSTQQGGHGVVFDWSLAANVRSDRDLILAGGLNSENIALARQTAFNFFDVSSGLEAEAGIKDHNKIRTFMKAVHNG